MSLSKRDIGIIVGLIFSLVLLKIIINLFYNPLENLISQSLVVWLIYEQIPHIFIVLFVIVYNKRLIGFSNIKFTFSETIRYFYSSLILAGVITISYLLISVFQSYPALLQVDFFIKTSKDFSPLFYLKILLIAPLFEELIYRGILLALLLHHLSPKWSILLSSILFSILHLNPTQFLLAFILGLFCGWYYYKTKNLLTCIIIHSISNLIGVTYIKYFLNILKLKTITTDIKLFQFNYPWLFLIMSFFLIIVGLFYLNRSLQSEKA
ncbi:MAG: CPBP family intramembrane metalloprotease [Candidatus Methanofastidiosa archaeon]|nr:CPBP family intramembrane metalloprotease [Candidatus Methanofastidiosa archaeon]